ncbi:ABC transporter substrate-binding protein [Salidesulfovibrio onnuriiensis]|uniref:ABC transporter substrate-binding protein n=1 Tax=Salidesulfovibrio onnuriiensis TaxID=2583823 RepID=UPI0011CB787C|nr:ABC transporter substrate-binding protein [Salidesulfovibrio onnuriiensis]
MRTIMQLCLLMLMTLALCPETAASGDRIALYVDADLSSSPESSTAIVRGIQTALSETGNRLAGKPVELVVLDHRGNSARSLRNLKQFLSDSDALALFCGMHSPPLLAHRRFINDNGILVLDPWAAAGPITRTPKDKNWIFRLSVDDSKAGEFLVGRAVDARGLTHPALILENTGWGQSNQKTITESLAARGLKPVSIATFKWGLRETGAKILIREAQKAGADVIFLVANAPEAKVLCRAMHDLPPHLRLPVISHWGITGGNFPKVVNRSMREGLDLEFIQTRFSFLDMGDAPFPNRVFQSAARLFPDIETRGDIQAPTGFIHAYDLTRILAAAVVQAGPLGEDMRANRDRVRIALENLKTPVQGLIKLYAPPFRPHAPGDRDAHEALGAADYAFGHYGDNDEIILAR